MKMMSTESIGRKFLETIAAALFTIGLFILMARLIIPSGDVPENVEDDTTIQITRTKRDERSDSRQRVVPEKPQIENVPPPPKMATARTEATTGGPKIDISLPGRGNGIEKSVYSNDRRATPLVRIPPQYPQSQISREQEGWVLVEFTITATGTTANAVIIDANPKKVFDKAVLKAIKRWKYQPKIVGGKAVAQHNLREVFRFKLEDS